MKCIANECTNCMHEKVCNKKDRYLKTTKDLNNYISAMNIHDTVIFKCDYYMQNPSEVLMYRGDIIGYIPK